MAPHSSTLAWKIPWMEEPGGLQSMGSLRVGHDWAISFSRIGEGNGDPLQCSRLENPRDGGAWWAAVYGVTQSRTRLKWLSSSSNSIIFTLGYFPWWLKAHSQSLGQLRTCQTNNPHLLTCRLINGGNRGSACSLLPWNDVDWNQGGISETNAWEPAGNYRDIHLSRDDLPGEQEGVYSSSSYFPKEEAMWLSVGLSWIFWGSIHLLVLLVIFLVIAPI